MLLQFFLVIFGARRYRSSSLTLRFFVWLAYISADAVAISAVGNMMHYARHETYGVLAPLLLLHLGGPDGITAYSTADNELWLRHGLYMAYQVLVTAYVIYASAFAGHLLIAAILLIIVGSSKYAERTAALAFASYSRIVGSTEKNVILMRHEEEIAKERAERIVEEVNDEEELAGEVRSEEEIHMYPLMGEKRLYDKLQSEEDEYRIWRWRRLQSEKDEDKSFSRTWLQKNGIVTIQDVREQENNEPTEDYMLCLSYVLFKMYKRRFVGLYFHEGVRAKSRKLFLDGRLSYDKLFRIVEMELKFMYDFLFSKSSLTAFSPWVVLMRFLGSSFLAAAGSLILTRVEDNVFNLAQRIVMYILLSGAFAVEFYQFCRILISDGTMVWLICSKIKTGRQEGCLHKCILKMIETVMFTLRIARNLVGKLAGNQYWKNAIQQYSVIDTCINTRSSCIWKVPEFFVPLYIRAGYVETKPVPECLQEFLFEKLKVVCSPDEDISRCRERVYAHHECLFERGQSDLLWASEWQLDDIILAWHIATEICAKKIDAQDKAEKTYINFNVSTTLSRYSAYLLLSHPNLLPLHPDTGKKAYMKLHYEMVKLVNGHYKNAQGLEKYVNQSSCLGKGTKLALKLLNKEENEIWEILADYWAALMLYIAVYNKAEFHAQCLTIGGQFMTQLWVLLGHMGCGEQSDSAVTKKVEDKTIREKEEEENRKKEEMKGRVKAWRDTEQEKRRQESKKNRLSRTTFEVLKG
ncbi:hypothetical protein SUGI_0369810 [Cryptomeria japonica]|nr:hypothetical protein SUGI_0369810 [Cryptomeria japonica]